jgi:hypothetical protein
VLTKKKERKKEIACTPAFPIMTVRDDTVPGILHNGEEGALWQKNVGNVRSTGARQGRITGLLRAFAVLVCTANH